jgi:hypothetical protein
MNRCSYFIQNKALFGSYPTQESVLELEEHGVRHFVDLTHHGEKNTTPYETKYNYTHFPIRDHSIPSDWKAFAKFILKLCSIIKKSPSKDLVYVHCRGGHSRSGIVVACVLCHLYKIPPLEALKLTNEYHEKRVEMKERRRRLGSPSSLYQRDFVCKFFSPLYFSKANNSDGLSNFSIHSVEVPNLGTFPTSEAAFHAHKDPKNKEYVKKQEVAFSPHVSKKLGRECKLRSDWEDDVKDKVMMTVLELKFSQHDGIRENLLYTGLRPIVEHRPDNYWGDGIDGRGKNMLGKLLTKLRNKMYLKEMKEESS